MMVDPFITEFSQNEERSHLNICDKSIITLGRRFFLSFSNTSHVDT